MSTLSSNASQPCPDLPDSSFSDARSPLPSIQSGDRSAHLSGENLSDDLKDPSPFFVRAARQQDLTHLAEVLTSSFHPASSTMAWLYPLLRQGIYEDMRMRLKSMQAHYACLVAVRRMSSQEAVFASRAAESPQLAAASSDHLVGTVEISLKTGSPWLRRPPYLYLSNLAVLENYRQQGVAQQLLRVCERVALDWGYQDLYLHVLENNARARRLYSKAGYQVERIETSLTSMLFGRSRQMFLHKQIRRG